MGKFNTVSANPNKTLNYEGTEAYRLSPPELELYARCATSLLSPHFYEKSGGSDFSINKIIQTAERCTDYDFISCLAVYLRNEMYLRSVSCLLVAYLALKQKLKKEIVPLVSLRADDIKEIIAAYRYLKNRTKDKSIPTLPNSLKKGLARAFSYRLTPGKMGIRGEYEFRKYNRGGREDITFLDVMRLVHPKPHNKFQSEVFAKIKNNALAPVETWETMISAAGSDPDKKREAWEKLISEDKLGYMAMLRNLNNMLKAGVDKKLLVKVLYRLGDDKEIATARQLPYRYLSAIRTLTSIADLPKYAIVLPMIKQTLGYALKKSMDNTDWTAMFKGKEVLVACDISGSMRDPISEMSRVQLIDVAATLSATFASHIELCNVELFATRNKRLLKEEQPTTLIENILSTNLGGSTEAHKVLRGLVFDDPVRYDYVVFFTDCQIWSMKTLFSFDPHFNAFRENWNKYKQVNPKAKLIIFDLAGYGNAPINGLRPDVTVVSGWSDKTFDVLSQVESLDMVKAIKAYGSLKVSNTSEMMI